MKLILVLLNLFFFTFNTYADCTTPIGVAGQMQWDVGANAIIWCNGTDWKSAAVTTGASCAGTTAGTVNYASGELRFCNGVDWVSMKGNSSGSCGGTTAGTTNYNTGTNSMQFCDGTDWYIMLSP